MKNNSIELTPSRKKSKKSIVSFPEFGNYRFPIKSGYVSQSEQIKRFFSVKDKKPFGK